MLDGWLTDYYGRHLFQLQKGSPNRHLERMDKDRQMLAVCRVFAVLTSIGLNHSNFRKCTGLVSKRGCRRVTERIPKPSRVKMSVSV